LETRICFSHSGSLRKSSPSRPAGLLGREPHKAGGNVRFDVHSGFQLDLAGGQKSANRVTAGVLAYLAVRLGTGRKRRSLTPTNLAGERYADATQTFFDERVRELFWT
jgi:hypothetical protein